MPEIEEADDSSFVNQEPRRAGYPAFGQTYTARLLGKSLDSLLKGPIPIRKESRDVLLAYGSKLRNEICQSVLVLNLQCDDFHCAGLRVNATAHPVCEHGIQRMEVLHGKPPGSGAMLNERSTATRQDQVAWKKHQYTLLSVRCEQLGNSCETPTPVAWKGLSAGINQKDSAGTPFRLRYNPAGDLTCVLQLRQK